MWIYYNPNPAGYFVDDCTIRALTKVTGKTWDECSRDLWQESLNVCDMQNSRRTWNSLMNKMGFTRRVLNDPHYTLLDFAKYHPHGTFVLGDDYPGGHVVALIDGDWYDTSDSGMMVPEKVWRKDNGALQ